MAGKLYGWGNNFAGALAIDNIFFHKSSPIQTIAFGTNWSKIESGISIKNTAAIKTDSTLWIWGDNYYGQLGNDTTISASSPIQTIAFGTDWSEIAVGVNFCAAVKTDGTLWTWGSNSYGQLGDDTTINKSSPVQTVAGGSNWSKVSCGESYTAATKTDGTLWLWGINATGQLGTGQGYGSNISSPVQTVAGGTNWSKISCGWDHTSAIKTDGTLWSWGSNYDGQLGDDNASSVSSPIQTITGGTDWSEVAAGLSFTAAIKTDGTLWVWGTNYEGQLGDDTTVSKSSPIQTITYGNTWSAVNCGVQFAIARKTDSTLWLWGTNTFGQIGDDTTVGKSSPVQTITFGTNWSTNIAAGDSFSAAIKSDNTLWLWGRNNYSQLGDNTPGDIISRSSPVQEITGSSIWTSISGNGHTGAIKTDGSLWLWGKNYEGQLGDDSSQNKSSPVQTIAGGSDWSVISCGYSHTGAIKTDGTLWLWGNNYAGQLGDNSTNNTSSPVQTVTGGTDWTKVSCGFEFTGAIKTDGTLWMWGNNYGGRLGNNSQGYGTFASSPVQTIAGGTNWSDIALGDNHVLAIKKDGTLWTWGSNYSGQLGDDSNADKSSPIQTIAGGTDWSKISATNSFSAAIKTDGTLWLWGVNADGCLGDDTTIQKSSPVQTVAGGTNWEMVEIGFGPNLMYSSAVKKDGTLWTWGNNAYGQLGDNSKTHRSSPVQTISAGSAWQKVVAGNSTVLAIGELANPATQLDINTEPNYAFTGRPLGVQPIILATDGSSIDPAFNGAITVSVVSGTPTLSGTLSVNAVNGTATFSGLILNGLGEVGLGFTASGLTSAYSNLFNVQQDAAIIPKRSEVAGSAPTSGQLQVGELAINLVDKKAYVKKTDGTIVNVFTGLQSGSVTSGMLGTGVVQAGNIASGAVITSAAGSQGRLQYNRSGSFGATSGLVYTTSGTQLSLTSVNTVNVALGLQTLSGNTGNMMEMKPFSGNPSAYFNASGYLYAAGVDGGLF